MLHKIAHNFAVQLLALALSMIDRIVVVGLLIRIWGSNLYGDWAIVVAAAGLVGLLELGLNIHWGNALHRASMDDDITAFNRIVSIAMAVSTCLAAVAVVSIAIVAIAYPSLIIGSLGQMEPTSALGVFLLLGLANISRLSRGAISQVYRARGEYARGSLIDLGSLAALVLVTLGMIGAGSGPIALAMATLAIDLILAWSLYLFDLRRCNPWLVFAVAMPSCSEVRSLVSEVRWLSILQGAPVVLLHAPILILGMAGRGGHEIVSFVLLRTLGNLGRQLGQMLSISTAVEIAGRLRSGSAGRGAPPLEQVGIVLSTFSGTVAAGLVLLGPMCIGAWSGRPEHFQPALAVVLGLGVIVGSPTAALAASLSLSGRGALPAKAAILHIILGTVSAVLMVRPFGATGVAGGFVAAEVIAAITLLQSPALANLGLKVRGFVIRCVLGSLAAIAWSGAVALGLASLWRPGSLFGLLVLLGVWGVAGVLPCLIAAMPRAARVHMLDAAWSGKRAIARRFKR